MMSNPYRKLGMSFIVAGATFAPIAYFIINSIPLTSIALSLIMIGVTSLALASTRPQISPEAARIILETGEPPKCSHILVLFSNRLAKDIDFDMACHFCQLLLGDEIFFISMKSVQ